MKFQFKISIKPTLPQPISFLVLGNIDNYQYLPIIIDQKRKMAQNRAQEFKKIIPSTKMCRKIFPRSLGGSRWLVLGK